MQHVFIIGSRGLPASYGGFETFVAELVKNQLSPHIKYHVACLSDQEAYRHFEYEGADCFTINPPKLGPARVIAYDWMAIHYALQMVNKNHFQNPIFYILGNTVGGLIGILAKKIHRAGGLVFVNPDGLEWKRAKWSKPVQTYLKYAEKKMCQQADLIIADNQGIETYLQDSYPGVKTTYLAYGTDLNPTSLTAESPQVRAFFDRWQTQESDYYLILGRFVPENNYETSIREFMASKTKRKLLIIANYEGESYWQILADKTGFLADSRVIFAGTVYDRDLLKYLRQEAFAYIHGHEVGGTNPGLLESLAGTNLNLVLDVTFNRQVAQETALYWRKEKGSLRDLIHQVDQQPIDTSLGQKAKDHMVAHYSWRDIVAAYEELFLS